MNFPRPGKIIRPLFGSSLGFVGLDAQGGLQETSSLSGHRCGWSCSREASPMNCPRPAKISFRDEFSKEKDCPINFRRLGKIIRPVSGSSSRLGAFGCAEGFHYWLSMNFPRPGKIIRSLSGRSPGFDGLDGQKACMMNFRRATRNI